MTTDAVDAYFHLKEAFLIREALGAVSPHADDAAAANQLIFERWGACRDAHPTMLIDARFMLDALALDVGKSGDETTLAIVRALAIFFGQLAAKADVGAEAFEDGMISAGRVAGFDLTAEVANEPANAPTR